MKIKNLLLISTAGTLLLAPLVINGKYNDRYDSVDDFNDWNHPTKQQKKNDIPDDVPPEIAAQLRQQMNTKNNGAAGGGSGSKPGPNQKGFSTPIGGPCNFTCPVKSVKPKPRKGHKPTFDGCGINGMPVSGIEWNDPKFDFRQCCNVHDKCYGKCNRLKSHCDDQFKVCMNKWCDAMYGPDPRGQNGDEEATEKCKKKAQLIHTTTTLMGCAQYLDGQKEACVCGEDKIESDTEGFAEVKEDAADYEHVEL